MDNNHEDHINRDRYDRHLDGNRNGDTDNLDKSDRHGKKSPATGRVVFRRHSRTPYRQVNQI